MAEETGIDLRIQRIGSMIGLFFLKNGVEQRTIDNYDDVKSLASAERYSRFFNLVIEKGIYDPPSAFETIFVSTTHTDADIKKTIEASRIAFNEMRN